MEYPNLFYFTKNEFIFTSFKNSSFLFIEVEEEDLHTLANIAQEYADKSSQEINQDLEETTNEQAQTR